MGTREISQSVQNISSDTRYIIRVRTVNHFGVLSDWSEALDITTKQLSPQGQSNWDQCWGVLGLAYSDVITSSNSDTPRDVSGLIVSTEDIPAGRFIRTTFHGEFNSTGSGDTARVSITDAANNNVNNYYAGPLTPATESYTFPWYEVSRGGPLVRKIRIARVVGGNTVQMWAAPGRVAQLVVEDLGPATDG